MKTTVKQLTAGTLVTLLLLVGNVNAEGTQAKASSRETIETSLQIEKWMIDESVWNHNSTRKFELGIQAEPTLELESWMTKTETWNTNIRMVNAPESALEIESWMTNENTWNVEKSVEQTETPLVVESWMTDNSIWNK